MTPPSPPPGGFVVARAGGGRAGGGKRGARLAGPPARNAATPDPPRRMGRRRRGLRPGLVDQGHGAPRPGLSLEHDHRRDDSDVVRQAHVNVAHTHRASSFGRSTPEPQLGTTPVAFDHLDLLKGYALAPAGAEG